MTGLQLLEEGGGGRDQVKIIGLMDKNNRVVIAWVGGGISGINGNENFAIKIHLKMKKLLL